MHARRRFFVAVVLLLGFGALACGGPVVDLSKELKLGIVNTGWFDAGIVNGQNKLVPAITLKLTNASSQNLVSLQLNAIFHRVTETQEWGTGFLTVAGSDGLLPGNTTKDVMVR